MTSRNVAAGRRLGLDVPLAVGFIGVAVLLANGHKPTGQERSIYEGPTGVLPPAVEHHDGTTYLREYPLNDVTLRVFVSHDFGRSWSTSAALPDMRHVHAVQRDPHSGDIWVTTGDTDAASWIGRLHDSDFEVVGGGSQKWRAVELSFTPSSVLWGMDCVYADENRLFKLPRDEIDTPDPTPESVGQASGSVYYSVSLTVDDSQWVVFSTAMEAGPDSTSSATQAVPTGGGASSQRRRHLYMLTGMDSQPTGAGGY